MARVLHSLTFCLVLLLTSFAYGQGQGSPIRPIRHSLPDGLQSVSGSLCDGGCTSRNGSICNLQDGGTSVLFDNTILPLSGLEGDQWARDLFTVRRSGTDDIVIGFDFGTSFQLRRVELVLFNCPVQSIRIQEMQIYRRSHSDPFPLSDPASGGSLSGSRLVSAVTVNSCENLHRICVNITSSGQFPVYYIVIPNSVESDWVYLAETIFHTDATIQCDSYAVLTEPVTPPIATTDPNIGIPHRCTTVPSTIEATYSASVHHTDSTTPSTQSGLTTTSSPGNEANPASGANTVIISVIVIIMVLCVVAVVSAVVIIFWVRRRQKKNKSVEYGGTCPSLNCFGTSYESQSGEQNKLNDAIVLTPATGQIELPPSAYDTIEISEDANILQNVSKETGSLSAEKEVTSTPQPPLEEMYSVVQKSKKKKNKAKTKDRHAPPPIPSPYTAADTRKPKATNKDRKASLPGPADNVGEMYAVVQKPKKPKNKQNTLDEDTPPMPPHTAADTYAVVNKKPKGAKKEGKVPPSSPPVNVGEMYAVVKKQEDETESPAIPPHTVDALYSC